MLHRFREHFGTAGLIVAIVALVAALGGGAYAATGGSNGGKATASVKAKKGPRGPKGATGPAGPAGPAGAQGPAGAAGKDGANGANGEKGAAGSAGTSGQSVTSFLEPPGGNCEDGGVKFISASPTPNYACNGANGANGAQGPKGEPWTVGGVLPKGETETGTWGGLLNAEALPGEEGTQILPIGFTLPLANAPEEAVLVGPSEETAAGCPGRGANGIPMADEGKLCIYAAILNGATPQGFTFDPSGQSLGAGVGRAGTLVPISCKGSCTVAGTWAVTAK